MKRFIKNSIFFFLPLLIVSFAIEIGIRSLPNVYKYKYNWMQQHAEDVEILVLGNSYSYLGISPRYIDSLKAFNLANVAQDYHIDYFLLKYWEERYENLKMVILPISYNSWFQGRLEAGAGQYRCRYYKLYMDCNLFSGNPLQYLEVSDIRSVSKRIPLLFKRQKVVGCDKWGWEALDLYMSDNKRVTEDEAKGHTVTDFSKWQDNYLVIKDIASFCKKKNVKLLLLNMPTHGYYYQVLSKEQCDKMYQLNSTIQRECGTLYRDYMRDSRFDETDFTDGHHLNATGAIKFSKILHEDIKDIFDLN